MGRLRESGTGLREDVHFKDERRGLDGRMCQSSVKNFFDINDLNSTRTQ